MIAVYLAMLETDVDRDKFMKLYESYEKKLFAVALRILEISVLKASLLLIEFAGISSGTMWMPPVCCRKLRSTD